MQFSIIVPVYNAAEYLDACIASVKAQSMSDWELILIDDGSIDGSGKILDEYAAEDARIHAFHQNNCGQFYARQKGIESAAGKYILFLDSDDELEPECLSTLDAAICKNHPDMILYTGQIIAGGTETGRSVGYVYPEERGVSPQWLREKLIASNDMNSLWLKAVRRKLFEGDETDYSCFFGMHCGEDKARLLYPVSQAESILYIPNQLYRYNYRSKSVMHSFEIDAIERMLSNEMFSMLHEYMRSWGMTDSCHYEMAGVYYLKNFISVYFNVRKTCETAQELRAFRKYQWDNVINKAAFRYSLSRGLSMREKLKLLAATMRL